MTESLRCFLSILISVCFLCIDVTQCETARAQDDLEWEDETLPDWLEELGYDEESLDELVARTETSSGPAASAQPRKRENGCLWCRQRLTGDWCGHRTCMEESGVRFRGTVTQFGFGVAGGINNPAAVAGPVLPLDFGDTWKYTGRGEYDLIVDLDKFGGMAGGKLLAGFQHWYGDFGNVSFNTGALPPAVFAALLPPEGNHPGEPLLTDFLVTQPVSEDLIVFAGKKNVVGTADQDIFAGGDGTDQFVNQALVANPAFMLALPYSSFTAGAVMPHSWGAVSAFVMDPQDRTRDFFQLDDLFSQGVILAAQIKVNTDFFAKPGEHHVGAIWKHVDLIDVSQFPPPPIDYPYPPVPPGVPTKPDSYTIYYGFDQYFEVLPGNRPGPLPLQRPRGWGLFGRASISDGNPTPFDFFLSCGVGGDSRLGCDRGDMWGLGWYYTGFGDEIGTLGQALYGPRHGTGVEAYYKFQVTPWLAVTPDIQYIRPELGRFTNGDDAFVYGIRVNMKL